MINAAAYTAVDKAESDAAAAFALNRDAAAALGSGCGRRLPVVHVSTDYVFDGRKPGAIRRGRDQPDGRLRPFKVRKAKRP